MVKALLLLSHLSLFSQLTPVRPYHCTKLTLVTIANALHIVKFKEITFSAHILPELPAGFKKPNYSFVFRTLLSWLLTLHIMPLISLDVLIQPRWGGEGFLYLYFT